MGTATADHEQLETKFAGYLEAIDDDAIIAARASRSVAARGPRRAARTAARECALVMPVIGQQLVGCTISVKFNTGWFNAEVLQVADGSTKYKFTRSDHLNGVVPASKGFMFVHFFDDEKDLWVSCLERDNKGTQLFNGRKMESWRLFN